MSYEWNPITTAPKGKPILVTDDESVWFGCYTESPIAHCRFFEGADLQSGETITISVHGCKNLTGWLPASATMWEPQKTGKEMLWELGYYKHPEIENCYEHAEEPMRITIEDDGVWFEDDGWRSKIGIRELLAVAQLIREKEATDNG